MFQDEDETRVASIVYRIGLVCVAIALAGAAVIELALPRPIPRLLVTFGFVAAIGAAMLLARRGYVRASARVFVAGSWLSLAAAMIVTPGITAPALSGFVLAIAAAGFLLGARSAYAVALISALAGPIAAYFDLNLGGSAGSPQTVSIALTFVQASVFIAAAALVSTAVRHADRSRALARLSEARFRALADHAPDMITEADAEGHFTYANPIALSASRMPSVTELARERVGVWMHPDDGPTVVAKFKELARVGGSTRASFRALDARGRVSFFEATGARYIDPEGRTRVVSVTRDMTRQYETAEALRESEARYRLLAEHAPDMIAEFDVEGKLLYANSRMIESLGFSFAEYSAMTGEERLHPDDFELCRRSFFETVTHGGPSRIVHRMRRKDGSFVWVAASGARHISARGDVHVIVQARDLTEELSLQEQLRQSQKMDAIGRLAGGVAHDFNNLLTVIGGYAGVLESSLAPGEAASSAHEIVDATERAAALTRQLLLLTHRQLAQPGVVDPNAAIRSLEPILRSILPERIELVLVLDAEAPAVELAPSQLDQVLLNLALNARDAMPGSGRLRIETSRGTPGRFVHLNVSDTGHGMDDETRARAFEPFFTTKPAGEGTGLGLSTTYGIVRQTGGSISLHSELAHGTRVEISLPACAVRPSPEKRRERAPATASGRDASILLVEDDASVRRLLAILLESAGYRVTAAADSAEALAIVAESQRRFDLLLSDYVMPGLSGLELANTLRATWPELRVVLMTGHAEIPSSAVADLPRGAELLGKPFTREQLQRVIDGMLAEV